MVTGATPLRRVPVQGRSVARVQRMLDAEQNNNTVIADRLRDVLVDRFEVRTTPRLDFAMAIAVEAGDALIKLAFRRDPDGDPAVLTEAKSLLRDYLTRYVTEPD